MIIPTRRIFCFILLTIYFISPAVQAKDDNAYPLLNITAGKVGFFDDSPKNAGRYGFEYRLAKRITKWNIIPAFGYTWSVNQSKYLYSDLKRDWSLNKNLVLTFSLGTGLFDNNKNIDLGHTVEFRSGVELSYKMKKGYRFGLAGYHLSNSRISNKNPGTESIVISLLIPLKTSRH
jgi:lipid A 3-O-deacylase